MRRFRVVHVDSGTSWRGGQRQALLLATGLRDRGHEPMLIGVPHSPLVDRARAAGLAVAATTMRADWDILAARKIRARVSAWNADLVHAHDARAHALSMLALLGRTRVPLIVTRRVPFTPRSARLKYGERIARFIAVSPAVRDAMVSGGIDEQRIDVVHSGIALPTGTVTPRDWRAERGWTDEVVLLGVVGAMTAEKGIDMLEEIGNLIPPDVRSKARIIMLGGDVSGPAAFAGIPAWRAGFVADIAPAVAGFDVLVHPSRAEGLGTAVLDAMAVGVPPLAFGVGGLTDVIEDGTSGILVPPGDTAAFARECTRLILDRQLRQRLGKAATVRAQSFDAAEMTKGVEAVYNGVLRG